MFLSVRFIPGDVIETMASRMLDSGGDVVDRAAMERRLVLDQGRLMLDALGDRDYPVVSAINLFFATVVVVVNRPRARLRLGRPG